MTTLGLAARHQGSMSTHWLLWQALIWSICALASHLVCLDASLLAHVVFLRLCVASFLRLFVCVFALIFACFSSAYLVCVDFSACFVCRLLANLSVSMCLSVCLSVCPSIYSLLVKWSLLCESVSVRQLVCWWGGHAAVGYLVGLFCCLFGCMLDVVYLCMCLFVHRFACLLVFLIGWLVG